MMPGVRNRDLSIDLLRFIALVGIILAHVQPTAFWLQLRNFDVPLMVFLSGVSYKMSGGNKLGYASYCVKRFKRLVLPVWIFLPIYFLIYIVATRTLPLLTDVISYYTLLTGWYVWIIRVFFVIALVAPLLSKGLDSLSKRSFLVIVSAFFFLFELFVNSECSAFRGRTMLLTNLPYMVVFAFGYKIIEFSKKSVVGLSLLSASIYVTYFMSIGGGGDSTIQISAATLLHILCFGMVFLVMDNTRAVTQAARKVAKEGV